MPTLIVHGESDDIVPIATGGEAAAKLLRSARYEALAGAPHGLTLTHTKQFNDILLDFLKTPAGVSAMPAGATM